MQESSSESSHHDPFPSSSSSSESSHRDPFPSSSSSSESNHHYPFPSSSSCCELPQLATVPLSPPMWADAGELTKGEAKSPIAISTILIARQYRNIFRTFLGVRVSQNRIWSEPIKANHWQSQSRVGVA